MFDLHICHFRQNPYVCVTELPYLQAVNQNLLNLFNFQKTYLNLFS